MPNFCTCRSQRNANIAGYSDSILKFVEQAVFFKHLEEGIQHKGRVSK